MAKSLIEKWLPVVGYEGVYEVSNLGRVKSLPRRGRKTELIMLTKCGTPGYPRLSLCNAGKARSELVHRMVAMAFISKGPIPKGLEVNHIDGDRTNAVVTNLELITRKQNIHHARDTLGAYWGSNSNAAKLKEEDIVAIREEAAKGITYSAIGRKYGVCHGAISLVAHGKTWASAGGPITTEKREGGLVKGQAPWGEAMHNARFTVAQVVTIRERAATGESFAAIGRDYVASKETISTIARGKTWASAGGPIAATRDPKSKFTDEQALVVVRRYRAGERADALAEEFGISVGMVYNFNTGRTRPHLQDLV